MSIVDQGVPPLVGQRPTRFPRGALALLCLFVASPARAAQRELSLTEVLRHAEAHAPRRALREARRGLGEAARADAAPWLPENPTLELAVGPRALGGSTDRGLDVVASLSQPIAFGLRDAKGIAARSRERTLAAEADADAWALRRALTLAYREGQLARVAWAAAVERASTAAELAGIAERRRAAGEATAIDARVAAGEGIAARQAVSRAVEALRLAQLALAELGGFAPDAPPLPDAILEPIEAAPSLAIALARAAEHPDVRARRASIDEARAAVEVADREGRTRPSLGVSYAREGAAGGSPASTIVLGTLSLPLPLAQRNQRARAQARAEERIARAGAGVEATSITFRVRRAHVALEAAAERARLSAETTASLAESLKLLQRGFAAGELPLLDVAVARDRLLASHAAGLAARGDYERARVDLEDAVGAPLAALVGGAP